MLRLSRCSVSFDQPDGSTLNVLRDVSIDIPEHQSLALLGRSGSGKSTLLNVLGLLHEPDQADYHIDGEDVGQMTPLQLAELRGKVFGFVFQDYMLMPRHDVATNVTLPLLTASPREWADRWSIARSALDDVGLTTKYRARPNQLSGGQQQRVAIARALVRNPRYILADEPTGALDAETGEQVLDLLLEVVRTRGASLVVVTHDEEVAARCDSIARLRDGEIGSLQGTHST